MFCPNCKKEELKDIKFYGSEINICNKCSGIWFDEDELRKSKDKKDENIRWIDVDLFNEDIRDLDIKLSKKISPKCGIPMYEVNYFKNEKDNIRVNLCKKCHGIWLNKGDFGKIIEKLRKRGDYDILNNYANSLSQETKDIFIGPDGFKSEFLDVLIVLKLFKYKFLVENQNLSNLIFKIISALPK